MPSSLTVSRREHRERSQPKARKHLGLLEKRKDYLVRSQNYKAKQNRLKQLAKLAENKNEDEFYFGMVRKKTQKGIAYGDRGNQALTEDALKVLRTQDAGYVQTLLAIERQAISRLQEQIHVIPEETGNQKSHIRFEDSDKERSKADADNKSFKNQTLESDIRDELVSRRKRARQLEIIEREIALQRNLQKKGARKKGEIGPDGVQKYKWKYDRKR